VSCTRLECGNGPAPNHAEPHSLCPRPPTAEHHRTHRREHGEASTVKRRTIRELAQWYAGGKPPGRIVLPTWKLYSEYIRAVRDAGLSMGERMKCRAAVVRRFVGKKHFIWRDVKSIPVQLFGGDVPA